MGQVMQKRQALDDEAAAMQRYMQANTELDELVDAFNKPEIGRDAKATYAKAIEQKQMDEARAFVPIVTSAVDRLRGDVEKATSMLKRMPRK